MYVPCPSPPRVWLDGSARAVPPGRVLGGRAYPPEPPAPPGLSHAPALPPNTRQPACQSARPGAARSLAQPPAALQPMSTPAPGPLPDPPRAPRAHRGRIQHRAPAGGPTRRVCLGRANGAIVPPPDPAARLSSLVRGDSTVPGKRGGAVVARAAGSGKREAAGPAPSLGWGVSGALRVQWKSGPLLRVSRCRLGCNLFASEM